MNHLFNQIKSMFFTKSISYSNPALNLNCGEFEINNWIVSDFILKKIMPVVGIHPYPLPELQLMVGSLCWINPDYLFEWGTHRGISARIFYETIKYFNLKTKIYSIDLPDTIAHVEHPKNERGLYVRNIPEVILIQGDGLTDSLKIYKESKARANTLFFLDGDHSYESVKRELEGITKKIPNANFLLHDTFYQSSDSGYNTGPYKALQEFINKNKQKYKNINHNLGLPGMSLLYCDN